MVGEIVEDRYVIEAELGEGAMGRVYRARHLRLARHVAIKAMHRELARVPTVLERFAREARIAARLRHPNLVSVLDVGSMPDKRPMIVLELAPGRKLAELIAGPMAAKRVVSLTRQLLRGLLHAHAVGLIHRDLKPDNILVELTASGVEIARIVDFGIAVQHQRDESIEGRRLTEVNTVIGTPFYMSPEQSRAQELDPRSDLFSLGVIMYELLAGMTPFAGEAFDVTLANATKDPPPIEERAGVSVDSLLEAFARRLMARRRDERFQTAHEALEVLDLVERDRIAAARAIAGQRLEPRDEPTEALPPVPKPRRHVVAVMMAAAVMLGGVMLARGSAPAASGMVLDVAPSAELVAAREQVVAHMPAMSRAPAISAARATIAAPAIAAALAPELVPPPRDDSAAALAQRYAEVGRALKSRADDLLWERFRRIRVFDAMATADARRAALDELERISSASP